MNRYFIISQPYGCTEPIAISDNHGGWIRSREALAIEAERNRLLEENTQLRATIKRIRDMLIKIVNDEDDRKCAEWDQAKKKR